SYTARQEATRTAKVRVLWELFAGASEQKKASCAPLSIEEAATPQIRSATKARGLKKADWEADSLFMSQAPVTKNFLLQAGQRCRDIFCVLQRYRRMGS